MEGRVQGTKEGKKGRKEIWKEGGREEREEGQKEGRRDEKREERKEGKWARLNPSAGQFWPTGRMFDTPGLYSLYIVL